MNVSRYLPARDAGVFLTVKKFPFPAYRARRTSCDKKEPKRDVYNERKKGVTRSLSLAKVNRNPNVPNVLNFLQEYPCNSAKLIRPVSVSFFNTQFGKKKMVVKPVTPLRRIPKSPAHHLKLNPKDYIKSVRINTQETLNEYSELKALKEMDSVQSEECKSSNRRIKVKIQAWIPLPVHSIN